MTSAACVAQRGAAWRGVAQRGAACAVQRGAWCKMDDKHARQRIQLEKMGGRPASFCEQRPQAALAQLWLEHTGGAWRSVGRGVARGARCSAVRGPQCAAMSVVRAACARCVVRGARRACVPTVGWCGASATKAAGGAEACPPRGACTTRARTIDRGGPAHFEESGREKRTKFRATRGVKGGVP